MSYEKELFQLYFQRTFLLCDFLKEFFSLDIDVQKNIYLTESYVCLTSSEPKSYSVFDFANLMSVDVFLFFYLM
jgi:hypothetical protein